MYQAIVQLRYRHLTTGGDGFIVGGLVVLQLAAKTKSETMGNINVKRKYLYRIDRDTKRA
ncbi:MAG: hypothetical protein HXY49_04230 [Ignavibacteriaceae bacterium]|nr:hypothetical protein [Ignavibacteriaceae bacterium]